MSNCKGCNKSKANCCCIKNYRGEKGPAGDRGPRGLIGETGPEGPAGPADFFSLPIYDDATPYKIRTSLTYVGVARMEYPGSANVSGTLDLVEANVWNVPAGVGVCSCRIQDITNSLTIAENTNITNGSAANIETLTIIPANIPVARAVWEIQIAGATGGGASETGIGAVTLKSI